MTEGDGLRVIGRQFGVRELQAYRKGFESGCHWWPDVVAIVSRDLEWHAVCADPRKHTCWNPLCACSKPSAVHEQQFANLRFGTFDSMCGYAGRIRSIWERRPTSLSSAGCTIRS